jgi:membrane protease YdiL (CAAX protease family)
MAALAVGAVLIVTNVADKYGPHHTGLVVGPAVALGLVVLARRVGLSWDDLGMSRRRIARGFAYAAVAIASVAVVYLLGIALPATRGAFLDTRYRLHPGPALLTALVVIPLGTVLVEEVAFRGVVLGLVRKHHGTAWAMAASSVLFGLWHVLPSLRLAQANHSLAGGQLSQLATVLAAVGFTAVAGLLMCELRRRSGSLVAAAGLHWATNGLAVLLAAALWTAQAT